MTGTSGLLGQVQIGGDIAATSGFRVAKAKNCIRASRVDFRSKYARARVTNPVFAEENISPPMCVAVRTMSCGKLDDGAAYPNAIRVRMCRFRQNFGARSLAAESPSRDALPNSAVFSNLRLAMAHECTAFARIAVVNEWRTKP